MGPQRRRSGQLQHCVWCFGDFFLDMIAVRIDPKLIAGAGRRSNSPISSRSNRSRTVLGKDGVSGAPMIFKRAAPCPSPLCATPLSLLRRTLSRGRTSTQSMTNLVRGVVRGVEGEREFRWSGSVMRTGGAGCRYGRLLVKSARRRLDAGISWDT
jgi:hypothetical protein